MWREYRERSSSQCRRSGPEMLKLSTQISSRFTWLGSRAEGVSWPWNRKLLSLIRYGAKSSYLLMCHVNKCPWNLSWNCTEIGIRSKKVKWIIYNFECWKYFVSRSVQIRVEFELVHSGWSTTSCYMSCYPWVYSTPLQNEIHCSCDKCSWVLTCGPHGTVWAPHFSDSTAEDPLPSTS
jgi:hypothetical protein